MNVSFSSQDLIGLQTHALRHRKPKKRLINMSVTAIRQQYKRSMQGSSVVDPYNINNEIAGGVDYRYVMDTLVRSKAHQCQRNAFYSRMELFLTVYVQSVLLWMKYFLVHIPVNMIQKAVQQDPRTWPRWTLPQRVLESSGVSDFRPEHTTNETMNIDIKCNCQ